MIETLSKKPYGFGRTFRSTGTSFDDKIYLEGKPHGFYRQIKYDGKHYIG